MQTALSGKPEGKPGFGPAKPTGVMKAKGVATPIALAPAMRARRLSCGSISVFGLVSDVAVLLAGSSYATEIALVDCISIYR